MNPAGVTTALDAFIVSRARTRRPRVCFVGTASGDSSEYIARFYRAYSALDCIPTDLTLIESGLPRRPESSHDLPAFLAEQDVLYVGGGNTANMLAVWRAHDLDAQLRLAWGRGTILCGISAGMVCWFDKGVTDSYGALDALDDGLGFLPGSACPHYNGERRRPAAFHRMLKDGELTDGYAADDGVALVFDGPELAEVVAERDDATAYRVSLEASGEVTERPLVTRRL